MHENGTIRSAESKLGEHKRLLCLWGGKKCSFFEKFGVLCFPVTPVLRFALLPNNWYIIKLGKM